MSDGYAHEPDAEDSTTAREPTGGAEGPNRDCPTGDASARGGTARDSSESVGEPERVVDGHAHHDEVDREFDWRGWILVGAIFVGFLLVPGFIYAYPYAPTWFGLTFWDTYLALPMIPAIVLGILAVWATTRP